MVSVPVPQVLPAARVRGRDRSVDPVGRRQLIRASLFLVSHALLAVAAQASPVFSTAHACITLLVGLVIASSTRNMARVAYVVAYIVGCEVLWRMTRAAIPWEFAKYAISLVMLIAIIRIRPRRNRGLTIAYFVLLLPSAALTFVTLGLDQARQEISFNLAGPLAIAVAVLFFSNIRLTAAQLRTTCFAIVGPTLAIVTISFLVERASEGLDFANGSNLSTSGGFGPNQVSAILGLAVLFLMLMVLERRLSWRVRAPLLVLAAIFAAQSALTFARGGIVLALVGTLAAAFVTLRRNRRGRLTLVGIAVLTFGIGRFVIEPALDRVTEGKLGERYSSTKSSGRDLFISSELDMFAENPVLGVGPGVGIWWRNDHGLFSGASHTEYSRMLGEHGMLGIISFCCLAALWIRAVRHARSTASRALAVAFVGWFVLFLAVYGIRIVAPALVLGLAFVVSTPEPRNFDDRRLQRP